MALTATKIWTQKEFTEELASMGGSEYYSVVGPIAELADNKKCVRAPGIPKKSQSHPVHRLLKAVALDAGPGLAERIVTVRYQWNPPAPTTGNAGGTQTNQVRISWGEERRSISVERDQSGNLITNSAGDVVDPPPTEDLLGYTCRIVRWEQKFDIVQAYKFTGKVNSADMFAGGVKFPAGTVRMVSILPEGEYTPDQKPIPIVYTLAIRSPLAGEDNDFAKFPYLYWMADIGIRSHYEGGGTKLGDLYWKDGTVVGDRVDQPIPLYNGAPIRPADFLVTSLGKAPTTKNRLPTRGRPKYIRVGDVYWIGWDTIPKANLLELGL